MKHFLLLWKAIEPLKIIVRMQVRGDSESSAPALSESPLTFIPTTILKGVLWSSKVSATFFVDTLYLCMYIYKYIPKLVGQNLLYYSHFPYSCSRRRYVRLVNSECLKKETCLWSRPSHVSRVITSRCGSSHAHHV